jgi:hypothetical protein
MIANEADLSVEIQSWGHSLAQAANLHLMLANERTRYFEAPMPREAKKITLCYFSLPLRKILKVSSD